MNLNKNIATVLSFLVCGLGQIYKGFVLKGIILFMSLVFLCGFGWWSYTQFITVNYTYNVALGEIQTALDSSPTEEKLTEITNNLNTLKEDYGNDQNKLLFYKLFIIVSFVGAILIWLFNIYDANKINKKMKDYEEDSV